MPFVVAATFFAAGLAGAVFGVGLAAGRGAVVLADFDAAAGLEDLLPAVGRAVGAGFACLPGFADLAGGPAAAVLAGVALRTGDFSADERLAMGLGRAAGFAAVLRPFGLFFAEELRGSGRGEGLFAPLAIGLLMRSTQLLMATPPRNCRNAQSLP
ncbi:MAG TPA: hypothetical protein VGV38_22930 [Pyrinomonadaceae bacterium]|nr:hypothetical protein [Pyrinomonadaceae bacterium]